MKYHWNQYFYEILFTVNPNDSDCRKIANIYHEFTIEMVCNIMKIIHCFLLVFLRGFNFSIFTHFVIVKSGWTSV